MFPKEITWNHHLTMPKLCFHLLRFFLFLKYTYIVASSVSNAFNDHERGQLLKFNKKLLKPITSKSTKQNAYALTKRWLCHSNLYYVACSNYLASLFKSIHIRYIADVVLANFSHFEGNSNDSGNWNDGVSLPMILKKKSKLVKSGTLCIERPWSNAPVFNDFKI